MHPVRFACVPDLDRVRPGFSIEASSSFELSSVAGPHNSELSVSIRHLLLDHACRTDESPRFAGPRARRSGQTLDLDAARAS